MRSERIQIGSLSIACVMAFAVAVFPTSAAAGETLARVQSNGVVRCGVSEGIAGFSTKDASGRWTGMDADFCRAVTAAALGDGEKVVFIPLFASARFPAMKANQIDLLARNTTQTLGREANIGTHFAGILYVVRVVEAVGNYGEMFERNLGSRSALKIERGLNRLWNQGGLMYSPPFR